MFAPERRKGRAASGEGFTVFIQDEWWLLWYKSEEEKILYGISKQQQKQKKNPTKTNLAPPQTLMKR